MNLDQLIEKIKEYEPVLFDIIFKYVFIDILLNENNVKNNINKIEYIKYNLNSFSKDSEFCNNKKLKMILLGEEMKIINEMCFMNCINLEFIKISQNITSIKSKSFSGCRKIKNISLPNKLKYIGYRAFCDCINLTKIVIPKSVEYIGYDAFENCKSLKEVYICKDINYFKNTFPNHTKIITIDT
tara:strand:+ start:367 stop:921 length:555 start_codon:yes stop_codon:yes gene_type:complete